MSATQYTDAIALLKADHRKVAKLFEEFESAKVAKKGAIADKICTELKIHTIIEEELFYPALAGKIEQADLSEAYVEHDAAKIMINDILAAGQDDEFFEAKVKVLSEEITHHVKEEEEPAKGLFALARATDVDLEALGDVMAARKDQLMEQAKASGLPEAELTALHQPAA